MGPQTRTHSQDFVQVLSGLAEPLSVGEPTLGVFCLFQLPDVEHYVDLEENLLSFCHPHQKLFIANVISFVLSCRLRYLGPGAVRLPVELRVWEHIQAHVADPSGHLMFPQEKEDLCQQVQGERITAGQVYGLRTPTIPPLVTTQTH